MKNLIWILAAIMLAGCGDNEEGQDMGLHGDPPGYSLFIWSNESDHRITMTVTDRFEKKRDPSRRKPVAGGGRFRYPSEP